MKRKISAKMTEQCCRIEILNGRGAGVALDLFGLGGGSWSKVKLAPGKRFKSVV